MLTVEPRMSNSRVSRRIRRVEKPPNSADKLPTVRSSRAELDTFIAGFRAQHRMKLS